jgi:hypothetical protein
MFHKFQVSHVTHQYFFLERTWLVYIQDGYDLSQKKETITSTRLLAQSVMYVI